MRTRLQTEPVRNQIRVWRLPELENAEMHRGTSVVRVVPRHWHDELNFCGIEGGSGYLFYRGSSHFTPAGSLFILPPGEVHSNETYDERGCTYRNLYLPSKMLLDFMQQWTGRERLPHFREPVLFDARAVRPYLKLHRTLEQRASRLEQESRLQDFLLLLVRGYASERTWLPVPGRERAAVRRVREYLMENFSENVSLERLATIANLSPFHLSRVFRAEWCVPPHAFQTQVRVLRAKSMLQWGWPISRVAAAAGFADQSHFTRHFKRLVGVTPGKYSQGGPSLSGATWRP